MKVIELTINTEPVAKGRPRTAFKNGAVRTYTPERTMIAQDYIVASLQPYKEQCFPPHIAVKLTCTFYRHKSKWLPKREHQPFRKPDLDNFLKLLLDSMNGLLIADDAQITTINMKKRWSPDGTGYITLRLEEDSDASIFNDNSHS
jgi:Holliday junction resolvase RusA-like endonuclease